MPNQERLVCPSFCLVLVLWSGLQGAMVKNEGPNPGRFRSPAFFSFFLWGCAWNIPDSSRCGFWPLSCWCWELGIGGAWSPHTHRHRHSLLWGRRPTGLRTPGGVGVGGMSLGLRGEGSSQVCECLNRGGEERTERLSRKGCSNPTTGRFGLSPHPQPDIHRHIFISSL